MNSILKVTSGSKEEDIDEGLFSKCCSFLPRKRCCKSCQYVVAIIRIIISESVVVAFSMQVLHKPHQLLLHIPNLFPRIEVDMYTLTNT